MNSTEVTAASIPGQRRDQILDAANVLFAERAYDEVSVEDIASSAGVTRGLVHHYFGGRKEVYIGLLERLGAQREEQLRPPRVAAPGRAWRTPCRAGWTGPRRTARSGSPRSRTARTSPTPRSGASSPTSYAAPSRCSRPFTPTSPRTRRGCVTRSSAGPASTAPRRDAGCTGGHPRGDARAARLDARARPAHVRRSARATRGPIRGLTGLTTADGATDEFQLAVRESRRGDHAEIRVVCRSDLARFVLEDYRDTTREPEGTALHGAT